MTHEFRPSRFGDCRLCGKPENHSEHTPFDPFVPDPIGDYAKAEADRYSILDY